MVVFNVILLEPAVLVFYLLMSDGIGDISLLKQNVAFILFVVKYIRQRRRSPGTSFTC